MSTHKSAADKVWVRSHREFYTRLGWRFLPRIGGRGTKAEKVVDGKVVHTISMCCMGRLLIQIKVYESGSKRG